MITIDLVYSPKVHFKEKKLLLQKEIEEGYDKTLNQICYLADQVSFQGAKMLLSFLKQNCGTSQLQFQMALMEQCQR